MNTGQHISRRYSQELEGVRAQVLAMGGLVEQQLTDALTALHTGDAELAQAVVTGDYRVNAMEVAIDEECTRILARRQPAAGDLRLVIAIIKTITDLERIGDEAERIGRMALHLEQNGKGGKAIGAIAAMGEMVRKNLHDALDAFARVEPEAAIAVAREDLKVDRVYEGIMRELITFMMEDPRSIPNVIDVMWSARALERIGDRARNICEYVIYLVHGRDVRHISIEQVEAAARGESGGTAGG